MSDKPDYGNPPPGQMSVRIQLTSDRKKAKRQYEELMRSGQFEKAVIIAELTNDRGYHVLSQGMTLDDIPKALFATVKVLDETTKHQQIPRAGMNFGVSAGFEVGRAGPALKDRAVTKDADGLLHPPPGQTFVTCGECESSSWYMTLDANDQPVLMVCTKCQNEVKMRRDVHHSGGTA
jgi:hypothetical protein